MSLFTCVFLSSQSMMGNKDRAVKGLTGGIEFLFKKNKVDYVKGFGKISGPNAVQVKLNEGGEQTLQTKNILIATGRMIHKVDEWMDA